MPGSMLSFRDQTLFPLYNFETNVGLSFVVSAPQFPLPVSLSLAGPSTIDACSPLQLAAMSFSQRPLLYQWACSNDAELDSQLKGLTGATVSFGPGTAELQTYDKTYDIAVTATDFLGTRSAPVTLRVFKRRAPAPVIKLTPPAVSTTQNLDVLVLAAIEFSSCNVQRSEFLFSWAQSGGPVVTSPFLNSSQSQLFLPSGTLAAGNTYVFDFVATARTDSSVTARSSVT
eukprot:749874-Hanusia_phi.AAC.1